MYMIVVGCGRVGAELAYRLYLKGHKVAVIDNNEASFANLPQDFRGRTLEGEPLEKEVLHRAGIEHADGLAVVTNSDTMNAVIAHVARTVYGLNNIVVRNYENRWRSLYEAFGQQVISSSSWGAQRLEEMLYNTEISTVFSAGNGEVEIYELTIPSNWSGRQLVDLLPDTGCIPVSLTRGGRAYLPSKDTIVEENDILLVSATLEGVEDLRRRLDMMQAVKEA